jgi:hypothetical protein
MEAHMIRVYVAGRYSADNVVDVLKNIGRGDSACANLFKLGLAPFSPWADRNFIIQNPNDDFTVQQFYDYSMVWLEVSDCVFVLPGWMESVGTVAEVARAKELAIPVFYHEMVLLEWARGQS